MNAAADNPMDVGSVELWSLALPMRWRRRFPAGLSATWARTATPLVAGFVLVLWTAGSCPAIDPPHQQRTVRGLFGDRTLGHALRPATSRFGGGIQRGPNGEFLGLGRADGSSMFRASRRQGEPSPLLVSRGTPPYAPAAFGSRSMAAPQERREQPLTTQQSTGRRPVWFRSPSPPSETTTPSGSARLYVPRKSPGWSVAGAPESDSTGAKGPFLPSPDVSARITRLARVGGVRTSSGMQVCLHGSTATVRGTVATSYQRSLVGNLVGLEPGVYHVNNLVVVEAALGLAAAETSR